MPFSERNYIDPWDVENYIYLRKGPTNTRRRSVCFDQAVKYASYQDDGYGPIYGSLIETSLKPGADYQDERSQYIYNSLPPASQCPSCYRDLNDFDDYGFGPEAIYEDLMARTLLMEKKRRRRKNSVSVSSMIRAADSKFGMNTLGHLRIDYSGNWNKLDRMIKHAA